MSTPDPRTPILVARGNKADLDASILDLREGELCFAFDTASLYVKKGGILNRVSGIPNGSQDLDLIQWNSATSDWEVNRVTDGGNF